MLPVGFLQELSKPFLESQRLDSSEDKTKPLRILNKEQFKSSTVLNRNLSPLIKEYVNNFNIHMYDKDEKRKKEEEQKSILECSRGEMEVLVAERPEETLQHLQRIFEKMKPDHLYFSRDSSFSKRTKEHNVLELLIRLNFVHSDKFISFLEKVIDMKELSRRSNELRYFLSYSVAFLFFAPQVKTLLTFPFFFFPANSILKSKTLSTQYS